MVPYVGNRVLGSLAMDGQKKAIWGWAMYDWANSAFMTTVVSGFFPVFFKLYWNQGVDPNTSTARLGWANSIASLIIALMAPVPGATADRGSRKKRFLIFFAYLGCLMTAGLFLVHEGNWELACLLYVLGLFGFSGSNIFNDSLLPTVALWWAGFTLITVAWVREEESAEVVALKAAVSDGFAQVIATLRKIRHLKTAFLFLAAYWLCIDGVDTIIRMAVDYEMSLGFGHQDLVLALLLTQFVAFPAAILYSRWGQEMGVRSVLMPPSPSAEQLVEAGRMASRWSIGGLLLLFVAGGILLYFVDEERGKREAGNYPGTQL